MAAPEGATSQFVFSPQGEGVQADWAATAVRQVAANATRHRRNIIFVSRRYAVLLLDYHAREPKFGEEQQLTVLIDWGNQSINSCVSSRRGISIGQTRTAQVVNHRKYFF